MPARAALGLAAMVATLAVACSSDGGDRAPIAEPAGAKPAAGATLADTPYPMQHADPANSDRVHAEIPLELEKVWTAIDFAGLQQPCSSGLDDLVYCALGYDLELDTCNLRAIDATDGAEVWEDRVDGECLLDHTSMVTNPLVDAEGNVYTGDSRMLVSFTGDGELRWTNDAIADLPSESGLPNPPFGINVLPTGELVTVTLGDGWILVIDPDTGELIREPWDLPSAKEPPPGGGPLDEQPEGFMDGLLGPAGADLIYDYSFGASDFEVDNNVSVSPTDDLFFVAGGAEAPNPDNEAGLWALRLGEDGPEVAFRVELDAGSGGVGTTPALTPDGRYLLMGDNGTGLVAVDVQACLADTEPGELCTAHTTAEVGRQLGISPAIGDDGLVVAPAAATGVFAFTVGDGPDGVELTPTWTQFTDGGTVAGSVATIFDNAVAVMAYDLATNAAELTLLDPATGEILSQQPSGDFANVTLASDGETFIVNNLNAVSEIFGIHAPAGVEGWRAKSPTG